MNIINDDDTIGPEILAEFRLVGSPTSSPLEDLVIAVVESIDDARKGYIRKLWRFSSDGQAEPFLGEESTESWQTSPTFSPDGRRIAFVSNRSGTRQAYSCDTKGGDIQTFGAIDGDVTLIQWLDAKRIVAVTEYLPKDEFIGDGTDVTDPVHIKWLRYKTEGQAGYLEHLSSMWILSSSARPDCVITDVGKITNLAAKDEKIVYSQVHRHSDRPSITCEVRCLDLKSGIDELYWDCPSSVEGIVVTSVSSTVVVVASGEKSETPALPRLWRVNGGSLRPLPVTFGDLECEYAVQGDSRPSAKPARIRAVRGSDEVIFAATVSGDVALFKGDPNLSEVSRITPPGRSVTDFSEISSDRVVLCVESNISPTELYICSVGDVTEVPTLEQISHLNASVCERLSPIAPEVLQVDTSDGISLSEFLYTPPGSMRHPLLMVIHGGPHLCYGSGFDLEVQLEVKNGYAVLLPNPRGSAGRGSHFRSLSVGEWSKKDYEDVISSLECALEDGRVDPKYLYIAGGSYGGYLTNWILTQTNRFRAAISERSVSNMISKYGTSDIGFTINKLEMGGADLFDESLDVLVKSSPLFGAHRIDTPVLLIHGEDDKRCPIEQSEQLFVTLKRLNKVAEFVRFPGEGHSLPYSGRPDHRIKRLQLIADWLDKYNEEF